MALRNNKTGRRNQKIPHKEEAEFCIQEEKERRTQQDKKMNAHPSERLKESQRHELMYNTPFVGKEYDIVSLVCPVQQSTTGM